MRSALLLCAALLGCATLGITLINGLRIPMVALGTNSCQTFFGLDPWPGGASSDVDPAVQQAMAECITPLTQRLTQAVTAGTIVHLDSGDNYNSH